MQHRSGHLDGARGVKLFWQAWLPGREPRAVIALAHGLSEHSGRYAWVAEQLVRRGYALYALDHRGHGRSEGPRSYIDGVENLVADYEQLVALGARECVDGERPFLLGHSMGGFTVVALMTRRDPGVSGVMLSAPLVVLDAASPVSRLAGHVLARIAPRLGVIAIDSKTVSRDPQVVHDYDNDPLNFRGKLPARTVHELAQEIGRFETTLGRIEAPLLVQVGTGDELVPPRAADFVYEQAASRDKTIKHYDGLYHEILNEPEREQVVADMLDWLDART